MRFPRRTFYGEASVISAFGSVRHDFVAFKWLSNVVLGDLFPPEELLGKRPS